MGNVYSAQNVAAYFVYELNEMNAYINANIIQELLADVNTMWQKVFGRCAFTEKTHSLHEGYVVKEVADAYKDFGNNHIHEPAREWYLKYGQFQLILRPYGIPAFTTKEKLIVTKIIDRYLSSQLNNNVAV
jgi:hypothetical protein